eukprot:COSAG01_NODE_23046_length_830_cov_1.478796_2_plen_22_part_01
MRHKTTHMQHRKTISGRVIELG